MASLNFSFAASVPDGMIAVVCAVVLELEMEGLRFRIVKIVRGNGFRSVSPAELWRNHSQI